MCFLKYKSIAKNKTTCYNKFIPKEKVYEMDFIIACVFVLLFIVIALVLLAVFQIRMAGIKIKDFYGFIQANQMLDKLARFARRYENMSPQEQIIYLKEAEKIFEAYDKIPSVIWEDQYREYQKVLDAYKNIRVLRWEDSKK